jgi:hypothetical protein
MYSPVDSCVDVDEQAATDPPSMAMTARLCRILFMAGSLRMVLKSDG